MPGGNGNGYSRQAAPRLILHRGFVCGICGAALAEALGPDGWETVCSHDQGHDVAQGMTLSEWRNRPRRTIQEAAEVAVAQDVLDHLPAELQAAIAAQNNE